MVTRILYQYNGAAGSETETQVTDIILKNADTPDGDPKDAPIQKPDTGTACSYEFWGRFYFSGATAIQNIRLYLHPTASLPTGMTLKGRVETLYATPTNTCNADPALGNTPDTGLAFTDLDLSSGGQYTEYFVLQLEIDSTVTHGVYSVPLVLQYDVI